MGYKTLRLWLGYEMVDLLMCTVKKQDDRQGQGKEHEGVQEEDSTINENNLKYKYEP